MAEGELEALLGWSAKDACKPNVAELSSTVSRSLDAFKGVLVVLMTYEHVDLTLMSPAMQYWARFPHFLGNMASGLCFLGFMLAYGFSCDGAYLSDWKRRRPDVRLWRVARSVALPVVAAWVCALAWGFMCFKLPMNFDVLLAILDFRMTVGNGPDFLLCFSCCLLVMYPVRGALNSMLASPSMWRWVVCAAVMLLAPLVLTQCIVEDCTGRRKYINYFLECTHRDVYAPVLPALPHLFYFNLGVLLSRSVKAHEDAVKRGRAISLKAACAMLLVMTLISLVLSYPLFSAWSQNYGNLMVSTRWGMVTRGFVEGPSVLWLLGNLFCIDVLFVMCVALHMLVVRSRGTCLCTLLGPVLGELERMGANVLLYLVVCDIFLAGLWRGAWNQYPLDATGGAVVTLGLFLVVRFLLYLASSVRAPATTSFD